jgi:hypothetical protein
MLHIAGIGNRHIFEQKEIIVSHVFYLVRFLLKVILNITIHPFSVVMVNGCKLISIKIRIRSMLYSNINDSLAT